MLSVVIPTRNRANCLEEALLSIEEQSLDKGDFEVLVIDNASSDNTYQIVEKFYNKNVNIKYHYESKLGLHAGRHRGIRESKSEILVFCDDDIIATKDWLKSIKETFHDKEIAIVGGNCYPLFLGIKPEWVNQMWEIKDKNGNQSIPFYSVQKRENGIYEISPYFIWGCNFSIRKSILYQAEGFHPDGMPESKKFYRGDGETSISKYIKQNSLKSVFNSSASVYHKVTQSRMTLEYLKKRGFNQGLSDSYSDARNRKIIFFLKMRQFWVNKYIISLKNFIKKFIKKREVSFQMQKACKLYEEGYRNGLKSHFLNYIKDRELRLWVNKKNYFDC